MQNLKINSLLILLIMSSVSLALESDRTAKIIFQGEGCTTKLKTNLTECLEKITIEQGSLLIQATYGLVKHKKQEGIGSILLRGDQVYMEQMMEDNEKMVIKANEIDYRKAEEKAFLSGQVTITSSIGITTGERLEIDLKTQEINSADDEQPFRMEIDQKDD